MREALTMYGETVNGSASEDIDDDVESVDEEVAVLSDDDDMDDNVGDMSVEINVEELVAKVEGRGEDDIGRQREVKRRLEELREQREAEQELDSTYNFNLDDEL